MTDITSFIQFFINSFASIFTNVLDTLDNIQFLGISYLDYIIALFILSVALPLVLTFIRSRPITSKRVKAREKELKSEE